MPPVGSRAGFACAAERDAGQRERAEWISELPSWFDQPLFLANERRLGVRHADTSPNRKLSARVLITTSTREMR